MTVLRTRHAHQFLEHTLHGLYTAMDRALYAEKSASAGGLLQRLDPRVKVGGVCALIAAVALASKLWVLAAIFVLTVALATTSGISIIALATRVWTSALVFTGVIALPALFLTPGQPVWRVPGLSWVITAPGLTTASYLILRVEASATLALLLISTTPWTYVLKSLRMFRVPVVFVVILGMTCRYILLMLEAAHEMFESRRSRTVGVLSGREARRMAIASAGVLLSRTFQLSGEVYLAMQARGFRGEVYLLDDFRMRGLDWFAALAFFVATLTAMWAGR